MTIQELDAFLRKVVPFHDGRKTIHQHASLRFSSIRSAYNAGNMVTGPRREHPENEGLLMNIHERHQPIASHNHDYFEMMYVRSGTVTHRIDGQKVLLKSGDFLLMAPGIFHEVEDCGEDDICVNFVISISYLTPNFLSLISQNQLFHTFLYPYSNGDHYKDPYIVVSAQGDPDVLNTADKMLCEFFDPDICSANILKCSFPNLLNLLFRIWKENGGSIEPRKNINNEDIRLILKYVESNYASASLKETSARFGYNPDYLSRLIKNKLGISFGEMKHRICMEQAKALLLGTNLSISEIAQQIGFSNMSYFYTLFDKYYQTTPAEFRKAK